MTHSVIHPVIPLHVRNHVRCDQCGLVQYNMTESGPIKMTKTWKGYAGCVKCQHPYGRYC